MAKSPDQLSHGFVEAKGSQVEVFPEDKEGDATFGLCLINLIERHLFQELH